jgi:ribose transport system substrate-binding protein
MKGPSARKRRLRDIALAVLTSLTLSTAIAACGSSSSSSSSSSSNSVSSTSSSAAATDGSAGVNEAQAALSQALKPPTTLGLPAWTKPFPTGKTVTYVHCGVAACTLIANALKNAASVAGWTVKVIPSDGSPAGVQAAWNTVVRLHPDAAFGSAFNATVFASALAKLQAMKIPVLQMATSDKVGNGVVIVKLGPAEVPIIGKQMAAWTVASSHGSANTLYVELPTFTTLTPMMTAFEQSYRQWCPTCKFASMNMPVTALGSTAPSMIVGYLRSHPDVNRVVLSYDGIGLGLPAALKAAGLAGKVQFIGQDPTETNLSYVQTGEEGASVASGYYSIWANLVDAAARYMTGQSLAANIALPLPDWVITKQNITAANPFKPAPDLNGQLRKLWNRSGT